MGITDLLTGGVGTLIKDVVGTFKLSPAAQLEFETKLEEHKFELAKVEAELEAKMVDVAGQNIRAETTSSDRFTSRARPTFLYIVEAILAYNYIIAPIFKRDPVTLPGDLLVLFGVCITGYVAGRSFEKMKGMQ